MTFADVQLGEFFVRNGLWFEKYMEDGAIVRDPESPYDIGTCVYITPESEVSDVEMKPLY